MSRGRGRGRRAVGAMLLISTAAVAVPALAQDMVYQPVNPSFGGNPFNSAHLLGIAGAQNKTRDPATTATRSSEADIFARQKGFVALTVDVDRILVDLLLRLKLTNYFVTPVGAAPASYAIY